MTKAKDPDNIECSIGDFSPNSNLKIQCEIRLNQPAKDSFLDYADTLTPLLSVLIAFFGLLATVWKHSKDQKSLLDAQERERLKNERALALDKIEKFYGPMRALREESMVLYKYFAIAEKKKAKSEEKRFRTLRFLTEARDDEKIGKERFSTHDQEILSNILDISNKNLVLIEQHGGVIDNPAFYELLGKLAAHFRTLQLAADGKLNGMSEELESIVFPREIDGALENEIKKINNISEPRNRINSGKSADPTLSYYDSNSTEYYDRTINIDMHDTYEIFTSYVPFGARILDAGCGVGRDTRYFIKNGFKVTSFDASEKMVEICNRYPFAYCEVSLFSEISYISEFDGIWACASLLHLDEIEIKVALEKLVKSLKSSGHLYFSLKQQSSDLVDDSRAFYFYSENELRKILASLKMSFVKSWESQSALNTGEVFENYVFQKC